MSEVDAIVRSLDAEGISLPPILRCTERQIEEIKASQGVSILPDAYEEFLRKLGRAAGVAFVGSSAQYPALLDNRERALEIIQEAGRPFTLGENHFVFLEHQGYQFWFFDVTQGPDPPVYSYREDWSEPRPLGQTFTGFLRESVACCRGL